MSQNGEIDNRIPDSTEFDGKKSSDALVEERLRIVEGLIYIGRGSGEELQYGLEREGHLVNKQTALRYGRQVRDRIRADRKELHEIRKEFLERSLVKTSKKIEKALKDFKVKPSWDHLIKVQELLFRVSQSFEPGPPPKEEEEERRMSAEELDQAIAEKLSKNGIIKKISTQENSERES
jgi:hypothetical protein